MHPRGSVKNWDAVHAEKWRTRIEHGRIAEPYVERMHDILRRPLTVRRQHDADIIRLVHAAVVGALATTAKSPHDLASLVCSTISLHITDQDLVPSVDDVAETFANKRRKAGAHTSAVATLILGETSKDTVNKALGK